MHGFIAGWGFGAFALIVTTVLAPAMPSAALGWLPGTLYGLGTTLVLAGVGALIGALVRHRRLEPKTAQQVAQESAGWTLLAGGLLFGAAGAAGLLDPSLMTAGIATGIHVYNLDQLNLGTLLVAAVVLIALTAMARSAQKLRAGHADKKRHAPPAAPRPPTPGNTHTPHGRIIPAPGHGSNETPGKRDDDPVRRPSATVAR